MKTTEGKGIKHTEDNLVKSYKKPKELDKMATTIKSILFANGVKCDSEQFLIEDILALLTQQRTELEQQKVKVVWNDVCEQIKQEARTELLEEIKTRVDTWGGFEDDGGNLCHYDSEILEWVNDLLNKKDE